MIGTRIHATKRRSHPCRSFVTILLCSTSVSGFVAPILPRQSNNNQLIAMAAEGQKKASSMSTALCIVPPEEAWDTIQRARYVAKDSTYRRWPPAIRMFHPFFPRHEIEDAALDVAQIVEKLHIRPFKVTLNSFAVIPHLEAIEVDLEAAQSLPAQQQLDTGDTRTDFEKSMDQLIEDEEVIGVQRLERRTRKGKYGKDGNGGEPDRAKVSPRERLEKQQEMYEEFNGPCLVVLEPDRKSRELIEALRERLRKEAFDAYDKYSPSSSISITGSLPKQVQQGESTFRPVIPIGGFASVTSAVNFARKLKGLWRPLTFEVTDLQFISEFKDDTQAMGGGSSRDDLLTKASVNDPTGEETFEISDQFGCDAAVMLVGEEIEQDQDTNEIMVDLLLREGIPGAGDTEQSSKPNRQATLEQEASPSRVNVNPDDVEELLAWLDEDDDDMDEGTVVVIGRTHFFSGETRDYDG
jgi:hypothetical protein